MILYELQKLKLKKYLGKDLYNLLKDHECIVAGGAILSIFTNKEINDVDVYFRNSTKLKEFLLEGMKGKWITAHTDKAILFSAHGIQVQTIYFKYFENVEELFNTFDFTVCMAAYDFKTEGFILHDDFLLHNVSKTLIFNDKTDYPIISALRVQKYRDKGFKISKCEFLRIMLTVLNLKIDNYKDLKEQMGGMYGENFDELIENKDEFDMAKVIEDLSKLSLQEKEEDYKTCIGEIDDWDLFVAKVTGEKIKYFVHNDNQYVIDSDGDISTDHHNDDEEKYYEKVEPNTIFSFPIYKYKYVCKKKNNGMSSFYDESFTYKLGEVEAKNKSVGLFACDMKDLCSTSYAHRNDKICLELRVNNLNDLNFRQSFYSGITYNKVFVTRIVPEEEIIEKTKREN